MHVSSHTQKQTHRSPAQPRGALAQHSAAFVRAPRPLTGILTFGSSFLSKLEDQSPEPLFFSCSLTLQYIELNEDLKGRKKNLKEK